MLRFDFLPSDFHPQFLILGERQDLIRLADAVEAVGQNGVRQALSQTAVDGAGASTLHISRVDVARGLRRVTDGEFEWELSSDIAAAFAAQIRAVAEGSQPAGSVVLAVAQFDLEEIPVWISQGEFTDNYLVNTF